MPAGGARAKSESGRFGPDIFCVNVNAVRLPAASTRTSLFTSPVAAARSVRDFGSAPARGVSVSSTRPVSVGGGARRVAREERVGRLEEDERQPRALLRLQRPHDDLPVGRHVLAASLPVEREDLPLGSVVVETHAVGRLQDEPPGLGRGLGEARGRVRLDERAADTEGDDE